MLCLIPYSCVDDYQSVIRLRSLHSFRKQSLQNLLVPIFGRVPMNDLIFNDTFIIHNGNQQKTKPFQVDHGINKSLAFSAPSSCPADPAVNDHLIEVKDFEPVV